MGDNCFYKYLGLKNDRKQTVRAQFLENCLFRFTQPNQLNDPFEVNPQILVDEDAKEDLESAYQEMERAGIPPDQRDRLLPLFLRPALRRMTVEEFPTLAYPEGIISLKELDAHNARKELERLLKHINETYGFFCLAESATNRTMWSHYAQDHKGIVVGFDAKHPFFQDSRDLYPVEYSDERLSLSSHNGMLRLAGALYSSKSHYNDLPVRLFLRKDLSWRDEKEWRMVGKLEECNHHDPNTLVYLFKVPREAIRMVVLGANISDYNETLVRNMATAWSEVKIMKARLRDRGFELEIVES